MGKGQTVKHIKDLGPKSNRKPNLHGENRTLLVESRCGESQEMQRELCEAITVSDLGER